MFSYFRCYLEAYISEPIGNIGENGGDGGELGNGSAEKFSQPFEITEPESIKKSGKYNLRKSLAWDSAFFESPGLILNYNCAALMYNRFNLVNYDCSSFS